MIRHILTLSVAVLGLNACKTSGDSTTQSLGGLAGDKTPYTCSASAGEKFNERYDTFWSQQSIQVADARYKESLKGIFAAVPVELQSWFFLKGGSVRLIGNPKEVCSAQESTPLFYSSGDQGGCVVFPKENELVGMPTIYVGVTAGTRAEQQEQASLIVSGFAAVLSSFLTEIAATDNLSPSNELVYEFGAYDTEMRNVKSSLAFMVIEDLIKNKNADGKSLAETLPDNYKSMISSSKVLDSSLGRDARWKAFWESYNDAGHREMTNFFVAQVFDAAWCSDASRALMFADKAPFSNSGAYFKKNVEPIFTETFSGTPGSAQMNLAGSSESGSDSYVDEAMSGAPSTADSFSLTGRRMFPILGAVVNAPFAVGRYFVKNQPVRRWFSTHRPVRRVISGAARVIGNVGRGVAVFSGRAVMGVSRVAGNGLARMGYRVRNGCLIRRWRC
ncbi:MAG: hypothetical protein WCL28_00925 [bacterium]